MTLKMYNIKDIEGFMKTVNDCTGSVYIISPEGDKLNLKSKLTQYYALAGLFSSPIISELELETEDPETAKRLMEFMMSGN